MMLGTGRIIKNYNGYYYVETKDKELHTCKVKGKLKQERFTLATGDFVEYEFQGQEGMITKVLPRKNLLQRPLVANVDLAVIVFACASPDLNFLMLDKLLALVENSGLEAVLVFNKRDLVQPEFLNKLRDIYEKIGYSIYFTVAATKEGIEPLKKKLENKISVFAGPSGAGKSTLLNALDSRLNLVTGSVSAKIGRGKHTTRFAQLLDFEGGYLVDTPGFSNINLAELPIANLSNCFREFRDYSHECKFNGCSHSHEPLCAVKAAVAEGKIDPQRYEAYKKMLEENSSSGERKPKK